MTTLPWGRIFSPHDNRGRESRTLFFVSVAFAMVNCALVLGWAGVVPLMTMPEYAQNCALVLAPWLGREWIKRGGSAASG